jgi:DNA-binding transcriptional regulator GbsR (MarR family)
MKDVWAMFQIILDQRKRRECDPTLAVLRECVSEAGKAGKADVYARDRIAEMLDFFEKMTGWYEQLRRLPSGAIIKLVSMGDKVRKVLGL